MVLTERHDRCILMNNFHINDKRSFKEDAVDEMCSCYSQKAGKWQTIQDIKLRTVYNRNGRNKIFNSFRLFRVRRFRDLLFQISGVFYLNT